MYARGVSGLMVAVTILMSWLPSRADADPFTFRGCFASGPNLDGTANADFNGDVDLLTGALVGTGSWQAGNASKLKNADTAAITQCISAAKLASRPGDEFVFFFSGHGGNKT